jgi:hypothetical protein
LLLPLPHNRRKYEALVYFRCLAAELLHRSQIDDDIEEELRSLGDHTRFKEECNEAPCGNFAESLIRDARFSLRLLRKSRGFTMVAVLALALAIGANAVVFGVLNALILRPLNVPQAESLYAIQHGNEASSYQSYPDYLDLRDRNPSFDGLAAYTIAQVGLDTGDNPSSSWGDAVSGKHFDVLRIQPYVGRFFHASDEHGPNSATCLCGAGHFLDGCGAWTGTLAL